MKSFVEQSERHYVSVPRHHLWSRIYIILRVPVCRNMSMWMYVLGCPCPCVCNVCMHVMLLPSVCKRVCMYCMYYDTLVSPLSFSFFLSFAPFFFTIFLSSLLLHIFHSVTLCRPFSPLSLVSPDIPRASLPPTDVKHSSPPRGGSIPPRSPWISRTRRIARGATRRVEIFEKPAEGSRWREVERNSPGSVAFRSNRDARPLSMITRTPSTRVLPPAPSLLHSLCRSLRVPDAPTCAPTFDSLVVNRLRKYATV